MQLIIDDKYLVTMDALSWIKEVEPIGDYNSRKYKVKGEPQRVTCVADCDVVAGDDAVEVENDHAQKRLAEMEKKIAAQELELARVAAVERIAAEKRGLSKADIKEWADSQTYVYSVSQATSDDVRKWKRGKC